MTLGDGSVATLGPRTDIVVKYESARRAIQQLTGEATYQVAKDTDRPFFVQCGVATVQAIGTKFGVTCDKLASNVTVAEGTVSVVRHSIRSDEDSFVDYVRADAGQRVLVNEWTPLMQRPVDVDMALAWERGRVIFAGASLEQAIREFNRRHKKQIQIPNPSDKDYRVFGEFDLNDPDAFVRFVEKIVAPQSARGQR